ncbi:MAG: FAD-dependent oxidoreductase [Clostridia bacterium]|nr:FAD-dependent oxidoreductase [Clostridia bacterium]
MLNRKSIKTDLCVVGGGLAGLCAAVAAAREGSRVLLMQERPVLGGNASSEIRMWVCGAHGDNNRETGIIEEIALENYYRNPTKNYHLWDTVLYDFARREPNLTLLLNCTCMDAEVEQGHFPFGRVRHITKVTGYQMTTQTFFDIEAKYYADCSGDSILAPLTGAEFRIGREGKKDHGEPTHVEKRDDLTMGMSCLLQGRETIRPVKFTPPSWSAKLTSENFKDRHLDIYSSYENYWYLELGGNRDTIHDTEEISKDLLALALGTWDHIKNSGEHKADNWDLEFLSFLPGKRESRRMMGEYIITANDVLNNTQFDDVVAFGGWPIDDHFPDGFYHKGTPNTNILPKVPYQIPYRCLYSKNVSNLYFAGRNISMTHMAMSSIRVMATCALLGQAVGTAAAVACAYDLTPHGVYLEKIAEVQARLMSADCFLPGKSREVSRICQDTILENGNECLKNGQDRPNILYGTRECGMTVKNGTPLIYRFDHPQTIGAVHLVFDSDLDRLSLPGDACERSHTMRCNIRLDSPQTYVPRTLCRAFTLEAETENGWFMVYDCKDNLKRAHHIRLEQSVKALRLVPSENWGGTEETRVFSFDFK